MSIKKNVAIVKLEDKLVRACLSDTNIYDLYKNLADDGGMKMFGVKDAAHLEEVINKQGREVILSANVASAKAELEAVIRDVLDRYFDNTTRKGVFGQIAFRYDHKNSIWSFTASVDHNDLPKKKRNGNGKRKNGNDLPNAKPASKKKRKGKGNGKKRNLGKSSFKDPMKKTTSSGKKKYDALNRRLPGHYGANQ